jgi:hypothetical protein
MTPEAIAYAEVIRARHMRKVSAIAERLVDAGLDAETAGVEALAAADIMFGPDPGEAPTRSTG